METEKYNCCKRKVIGVIYKCSIAPIWDRCKYYVESGNGHFCKYHSHEPDYSICDSCSCRAAIAEAEASDEAEANKA